MKNEIFIANPQLDCYFETADGECFFTEYAAKNHAVSLANKTVKPHHKSDYVELTEEVEKVEEVVEQTEPVEEIEVTAEFIEPTDPVEPFTSVEPKVHEGKVKNSKK